MYTSRRPVDDTSGSIGSMLFSQQSSQSTNLTRQNQAAFPEPYYQYIDGYGPTRLVLHTNSRMITSRSETWRVFPASDGFYHLYREIGSSVTFRRNNDRGEDSDASIDNFGRVNIESDLDNGTDIDPMNAGVYQRNLEEDSEWVEYDIGIGRRGTQFLSPEYSLGIHGRVQARNHFGESGDYIDARGFENLLEHLTETESSTRGTPPASVSFVNNMPCVTINEDEVSESVVCGVCKDSFIIGTVVNKLPCFHHFHLSCILPWLSIRNTCPLCRYEVPTDDMDYEANKRNRGSEYASRTRNVIYEYNDNVVEELSRRREHGVGVNEESVVRNNGVRRNR